MFIHFKPCPYGKIGRNKGTFMDKLLHEENNIRRLKLAYYYAAFLAFFGGVAIYAFLRNINNMLLFHFFPKIPSLSTLFTPVKTDALLPNIFLYNLPDGLWCLSGLLLVRAIWLSNTRWRAIYGGIFITIALSFEISQLSDNMFGTFDALDLVFMGFFAFIESIIFNMFIRRNV